MSERGPVAAGSSGGRGGVPHPRPSSDAGRSDPTWRNLLRSERLRIGLSQVALAGLVGVSPETIRKYEAGGRTPARSTLERIVTALQLSQEQSRAILSAAGFAAPETLFPAASYPDYYFTIEELRTEVERAPWPEFVTNDVAEVVTANRAAQALWGIDLAAELARRSRARVNILSVAAERHFSERVANWSECLTVLAGIFKGRPRDPVTLEDPGALFSEVLDAYVANDPAAIPELFAAWESTPAQAAKVRWTYRLVWREPGMGDIEFLSLVSVASEPDGLWFNDWMPVEPEGHRRFTQLVEGRRVEGR